MKGIFEVLFHCTEEGCGKIFEGVYMFVASGFVHEEQGVFNTTMGGAWAVSYVHVNTGSVIEGWRGRLSVSFRGIDGGCGARIEGGAGIDVGDREGAVAEDV